LSAVDDPAPVAPLGEFPAPAEVEALVDDAALGEEPAAIEEPPVVELKVPEAPIG
jgi:hypothetical protein